MVENILQKPPVLHTIDKVIVPEVQELQLCDGIPTYVINKSGSDVIKMDIVFEAGRPYEHKQMVATMCAALMREGTQSYTAPTIAEQIDFYGATMSTGASLDTITLSLVSLTKHFHAILPIVQSILTEPLFSEEELSTMVNRRVEKLKIDLTKNDVVGYRTVTESMYGSDHPYGYNSSEAAYTSLTVADLKKHFDQYICQESVGVYLSGDISDKDIKAVEKMLSALGSNPNYSRVQEISSAGLPTSQDIIHINGTGSQASIRLGRPLFNRKHPGFEEVSFVCNLLGGFFGSRLVASVRERLGLTYGIYSLMDTQIHGGTMLISTDVAVPNVKRTIKAIHHEMDRLCQETVPEDEMILVRNYIMGNYINLFDGPFNSLRAIKSLALGRIPLNNIHSIIEVSQSITSNDVLDYARRYLDRNDFWKVVVGASQER